MIRVNGEHKRIADEYFINFSSTYWTQGLIDGQEAARVWRASASFHLKHSALSHNLAEELFINVLAFKQK